MIPYILESRLELIGTVLASSWGKQRHVVCTVSKFPDRVILWRVFILTRCFLHHVKILFLFLRTSPAGPSPACVLTTSLLLRVFSPAQFPVVSLFPLARRREAIPLSNYFLSNLFKVLFIAEAKMHQNLDLFGKLYSIQCLN